MTNKKKESIQKEQANLTPNTDKSPVTVKVKCPIAAEVKLTYGSNADQNAMTETAVAVLKEICSKACISSVLITSTARQVKDQARIMYDMIKSKGTTYVKSLYGAGGKQVVATYEESVKNKLSADDIKKAMAEKIEEIGPSKVSNHIVGGDGKICVFDVAPSSVGNAQAKKRFVKEVKAHEKIQRFFEPPKDPAYHLEVIN